MTVRPNYSLLYCYTSFFLAAFVRRMFSYALVLYGFDVFRSGHSAGIFYFCLFAPYLFFSLSAGKRADYGNKKRPISISLLLTVAAFASLSLLETYADHEDGYFKLIGIASLSFGYGVSYVYYYPGAFATFALLVPRAQTQKTAIITGIILVFSIAYAPLMVGALRMWLNWASLFGILALLSGLAYGAVRPVSIPAVSSTLSSQPAPQPLLQYIRRKPMLGEVFVITFLLAFLFMGPFEVLAPDYLENQLGLSALQTGGIFAIGGTGMVIGSFFALQLRHQARLGTLIITLLALMSSLVALSTYVEITWIAVLLFVSGLLSGIVGPLLLACFQTLASQQWQGRVMSGYALLVGGMPSVGGLLVGPLSDLFSTQFAIRYVFWIATPVFLLMLLLLPRLASYQDRSSFRHSHVRKLLPFC